MKSSVGSNGASIIPPKWPRQDPDKKPELVAPGEKLPILNAQIDGTDVLYAWGSGTSGATVWVSGAIAHLLEHRPDLGQNGSSGGTRDTVNSVKELNFLGSPIDFIGFKGLDGEGDIDIKFIEVKSGKSKLNKNQRRIRDAVATKRIEWVEVRVKDTEIEIEEKIFR